MSLEQTVNDLISASGTATEAANALTQTVTDKISNIDAHVAVKDGEIDAKLATVDGLLHNHPVVRHSRNQYGHISGTDYQDWVKNGAGNVTFSNVRTIATGTPFADRPNEDQAVLSAMGHAGQYFSPNIAVTRLDWSGFEGNLGAWLTFDAQHFIGGQHITAGCYARLLSGSVHAGIFGSITSEWGQCGTEYVGRHVPGSYSALHPHVLTASGSIEFFWPGVVVGEFKLDRNIPTWSFFPSLFGTDDTAVNI